MSHLRALLPAATLHADTESKLSVPRMQEMALARAASAAPAAAGSDPPVSHDLIHGLRAVGGQGALCSPAASAACLCERRSVRHCHHHRPHGRPPPPPAAPAARPPPEAVCLASPLPSAEPSIQRCWQQRPGDCRAWPH